MKLASQLEALPELRMKRTLWTSDKVVPELTDGCARAGSK